MMRLWIDDVRPMPSDFNRWAKNYKQAIDYFCAYTITHVSFDHDLGDADELTGYDIAKWIEMNAFYGEINRMTWAIHSANPIGAKRIRMAMTNAEKYWNE
jgi:hypothetical protein